MEEKGDRVSVDRGIFNLVKSNLTTAQTAFKTFSNIDWIIQNDFTLEKLSFRELYDFTRAIISKQKDFCAIKQHNIIINDYNAYFDNIHININREFLDKALSEVLVNALKFSRPRTFVVVLVNVTGANAVITVVNDPIKGEDDILGIPPEYEKLVFEPFFRLSKLVFELYQTLDFGLGLTLVEKIVGKHGGETTARNIIDHSDPKRDPLVKVDITMSFPVIKE
jgi:signal transduction histidine kinase